MVSTTLIVVALEVISKFEYRHLSQVMELGK